MLVTLPTDEEILISREFDAPRHLVFKAWTEPELVRRWWSPRGEMTVCDIDLRVGGAWRYALVLNDGTEVAFHGDFREIVPDERLVHTEIYEGAPVQGQPPINIVTFEESDRGTRVEILVQCHSKEVRDMIATSGMEEGMQEQMVQLDELLGTLR
jgi:uncharacterized protein YndB with AHSA1/START domain